MPVGKRICFDSRRDTKRPSDLCCAQKLGVHRKAQPQIVRDEREFAAILRVPDAGDCVPRADFLCDEAAKKVQLVRHRHRDEKVGRIHARFHLRGICRAVSLDAQNIQVLARLLQGLAAAVNDRYLVPLTRELLGERASDLAVADNHNFHSKTPIFPVI